VLFVTNNDDIKVIRELAAQVSEISKKSIQSQRRELWRDVNSLKKGRPPIYFFANHLEAMGTEIITDEVLKCKDPYWRRVEFDFRYLIFKDWVGDDHVVEPFFTAPAVLKPIGRNYSFFEYVPPADRRGAAKVKGYLKGEADLEKFTPLHHEVDEIKTREWHDYLNFVLGDYLEVDISRRPGYTSLVHMDEIPMMLGMEDFLYALYDRPDFVKRVTKLIADGIIQMTHEGEASGDLSASAFSYIQAMPYCHELPDPKPNVYGLKLSQLWGWTQGQCYSGLSPAMTQEFLYDFQFPLVREFGLSAIGCCEDLTNFIPILKRELPNLRRVSVAPWADVKKCVSQLEDKYVISWRPNPATMVCCGWDPAYIRSYIRENLEIMQGCHFDITLKDVQTVENEPWRLYEWVKIVREVIEEF